MLVDNLPCHTASTPTPPLLLNSLLSIEYHLDLAILYKTFNVLSIKHKLLAMTMS